MSARSNQKPWPMKWIVLVIVLFIAGYTVLMLRYRKPGPGYQPYHDSREKATVARLESAGYTRVIATAERPADAQRTGLLLEGAPAEVHSARGGLPDELRQTLLDAPRLPQSFSRVRASSTANQLLPYTIEFTCVLLNHKQLLTGATVYRKETEVAIVADFEVMDGELLARTQESLVQLTLPGGSLPVGAYHVTLIGAVESKQWELQVH